MARQKIHESPAARTQAYRARLRQAGAQYVTLKIDAIPYEILEQMALEYELSSVTKVIQMLIAQGILVYRQKVIECQKLEDGIREDEELFKDLPSLIEAAKDYQHRIL